MLREEKHILWRVSASFLGAALPAILFGRSVVFALVILGALAGVLATKGSSLRASVLLLKDSKVAWVLLAIMGGYGVSATLGISPAASLDKWGQLWLVLGVAFLVFMSLREMPGRYVELMMKALAVTTVVVCLVALVDAFTGYERLVVALHGESRIGAVHRLNFMSAALAVISPFVWGRLYQKAGEGEAFAKMILWPVVALTLLTVLICGGRAGWAGALVASVVFVAMAVRYHGVRVQVRHIFGGVSVLVLGVVGYGFSRGWAQLIERVDLWSSARGFGGGRGDIWQTALVHMNDSPVFGIGLNAFRALPEKADLHPHNALLQVFLETGLVGGLLTIALVFLVGRYFFRYAQHTLYGVAALSAFTGFWVTAMANKSIYNIEWLVFFVILSLIGWRSGWSSKRK